MSRPRASGGSDSARSRAAPSSSAAARQAGLQLGRHGRQARVGTGGEMGQAGHQVGDRGMGVDHGLRTHQECGSPPRSPWRRRHHHQWHRDAGELRDGREVGHGLECRDQHPGVQLTPGQGLVDDRGGAGVGKHQHQRIQAVDPQRVPDRLDQQGLVADDDRPHAVRPRRAHGRPGRPRCPRCPRCPRIDDARRDATPQSGRWVPPSPEPLTSRSLHVRGGSSRHAGPGLSPRNGSPAAAAPARDPMPRTERAVAAGELCRVQVSRDGRVHTAGLISQLDGSDEGSTGALRPGSR